MLSWNISSRRRGSVPFQVCLFLLVSFVLGQLSVAVCAASLQLPETVAVDTHYLFYLHGSWIEQKGVTEPHPRYGLYRYKDIVQSFTDKGFTVISEARFADVLPQEYAEVIVSLVRELLGRGVPASHIAVIGHSKGGQMTMLIASRLAEGDIRYVVMAGCGKKNSEYGNSYGKFLKKRASRMQGRMLSLYDEADSVSGTCQDAFAVARLQDVQETVLTTGKGHGLFYAPAAAWVEPVASWLLR